MRMTITATVAIATALVLSACTDVAPAPQPTTTAALPTTSETHATDYGEVIEAPEASADSRAAALDAATRAVSTFVQPQLTADEWWRQMVPLLSQQAAIAYEGTDPAQIPASAVTGAGAILDGSTEVSLIVRVPTDAGPYNVTLIRPDATSPWLADRIRPAQG